MHHKTRLNLRLKVTAVLPHDMLHLSHLTPRNQGEITSFRAQVLARPSSPAELSSSEKVHPGTLLGWAVVALGWRWCILGLEQRGSDPFLGLPKLQ